MSPLLDVRDLETRFITDEGPVHAVNGVSFQVNHGEIIGIVGESGSGKSVSMLSILGLLPSPAGRVTGGTALFDGQDLLQMQAKTMRRIRGNRIAMIFQDPMTSLNPVLTIERQLTESLRLHQGMTQQAAKARAIALLQRVGIPDAKRRIRNYPHQFSGGMRQRVMIAMGLSCNPDLLIADEPTTSLDVTLQAQIVEYIKQFRQELGMAVIWITHDLALLAGLADRILVMYAGQIVEQAPRSALYSHPRHPYTIGLLQSIPRIDAPRNQALQAIEGTPPDLTHYPTGCSFAPRCHFAIAQCQQHDPPLETVGDHHQVACWVKPD